MTYVTFRLAYDAIEVFVEAEQPEKYHHHWSDIVPTEDWGYLVNEWQSAAEQIVANFNARLPSGHHISIPSAILVAAGSKRLIDFQQGLAMKADELGEFATFAERLQL